MNYGKCSVCEVEKSSPCAQCGMVFYCGKEHQKKDWSKHKATCRPYRIEVSQSMGRCMIALRDIKAGELILKESPLVVGPRMDSSLLCLGCHRILPAGDHEFCSRCRTAPVCGAECESKPPHAETECDRYREWFKEHLKFVSSNMQVVMPLRCLMLRSNSESWERFNRLESHMEERKRDPVWNYYQEKIVDVLKSSKALNPEDCDVLQQICAILDINSFELRGPTSPGSPQGERLRGIYLQPALMSHDCVGNTHLSVDDNHLMTIHASIGIKAGEAILFNYASPLEVTSERQERLKQGKYFTCKCKRCSDPTELGTYMGSILCSRCHNGCVVPVDPLSNSTEWSCEKCSHKFHERLIKTAISEGWNLVEDTDGSDYRLLENLLRKCLKSFPRTSSVVTEIKQKLVACYRDIILRESNPSRNVLKRKIILCQELLELLDVIEPGISRLRGITMYEYHKPKAILASKEYDAGEITTGEFLTKLLDCENILKEAISVLVYEPHDSPEGRLFRVAITELKLLREDINNVNVLNESECVKGKNRRGNKKSKK